MVIHNEMTRNTAKLCECSISVICVYVARVPVLGTNFMDYSQHV